ncbi:hypothetical protein H1235_10370 [Pseudoxanthomonas sp. NC8]|nr:hypothetical protein H1235_10370 [Pseudoxanthomonas sp. NC8]
MQRSSVRLWLVPLAIALAMLVAAHTRHGGCRRAPGWFPPAIPTGTAAPRSAALPGTAWATTCSGC